MKSIVQGKTSVFSTHNKAIISKRTIFSTSKPLISNYDPTVLDYGKLESNLKIVKEKQNFRPFSYAEKILFSHLLKPTQEIQAGKSYLTLRPGNISISFLTKLQIDLQCKMQAHKRQSFNLCLQNFLKRQFHQQCTVII